MEVGLAKEVKRGCLLTGRLPSRSLSRTTNYIPTAPDELTVALHG